MNMYEEYKRKRCIYKGTVFQSKLEARWAVIFDALGIDWIYEPETFRIEWGNEIICYCPDFYLPKLKIYVEVKPTNDALKQKAYAIGQMIDWEGPLSEGIIILGPIPDSKRLAYKIPCFSFLNWYKGVMLNYIALLPGTFKLVDEQVDFCEGIDGVPLETSVDCRFVYCGDKPLLRKLIDAYTDGWYPKHIEELD